MIINPGSGPVEGGTLEQARANARAFLDSDIVQEGISGVVLDETPVEGPDEGGRWTFRLRHTLTGVEKTFKTHGLTPDQCRARLFWPRSYFDGSSSWIVTHETFLAPGYRVALVPEAVDPEVAIPLLHRAARALGDGMPAPDTLWWRQYYELTGTRAYLTDEGWHIGEPSPEEREEGGVLEEVIPTPKQPPEGGVPLPGGLLAVPRGPGLTFLWHPMEEYPRCYLIPADLPVLAPLLERKGGPDA